MSNKMRWRYGETNPIIVSVDSATTIEIGDLLHLTSGKAIPATGITQGANAAASQTTFSSGFLGVAMQQSSSGDTTPIRVATTGYFEYDASSTTYGIGDKVGIAASNEGAVSSSQSVAKVTNLTYAIGRVARAEGTATSSVLITIKSVIMNGVYC